MFQNQLQSSAPASLGANYAYQQAVKSLAHALAKLKAIAPGPAAETERDKQALVTVHVAALHGFKRAISEFTEAGLALSAEELALHHADVVATLHPLLLESPFARRCFEKPLGYAGDYVMVRHILGDPFMGDNAFAQLVNYVLLQADVAQGHRNRIVFLEALLNKHAEAGQAAGRKSVGLTIGCGPAEETFRFVKNSAHADHLALTLLDFDKETLDWTATRLGQLCARTGKRPALTYLQESVYELAKKKSAAIEPTMDFVICAGLFDYLTDTFCKRVIEFGMRSLAPGGTLLVTNVSKCESSFAMSELLDWNLIYRTADELERLIPRIDGFSHKLYIDETGTNVIAEVART